MLAQASGRDQKFPVCIDVRGVQNLRCARMLESIGHYRVGSKLGAGAMGEVFRAHDERLEREVAVKMLPADVVGDDAAHTALLREARTISALNHPNICTIYEVGEHEGQTYIVMELVEGKPLSSLISPGGMPSESVVRYGMQIADALEHAHARGIVHRDLKSANIVVTSEGRAKVLDFGLARRVFNLKTDLTLSHSSAAEVGQIAGTMPYMAPEVFGGAPLDVRSDIWSVGVVLHEIASGAPPFTGGTVYTLTANIMHAPPPPLPAQVWPGLRTIIQRCLAKKPEHRYQRAAEVRAALEALLSHSSVVLEPEAPRPWARRLNRWHLAGASALLLIVAGGTIGIRQGLISWPGQSTPAAGQPLMGGGRPSANHAANEYFDRAMLFLTSQYNLARARQMLEQALKFDPHFAEARAWYGFTDLLLIDTGDSNDSSLLYRAEAECRQALQDDPRVARAHATLAAAYLYQGRKELVPGEIDAALKDSPGDLDSLIWLADYHQFNGDYAPATELTRRVIERAPLFYPARTLLGYVLWQQGDLAGALSAENAVLEQDPDNVYALLALARVNLDQHDAAAARSTMQRIAAGEREKYRARMTWALVLAMEGKRDAALKEMDHDLLKYATIHIWSTSYAAEFYAMMGMRDEALEWLDRASRNGDDRAEWFQRDPLLSNLRDDARFQQLVQAIADRRPHRPQSATPRK